MSELMRRSGLDVLQVLQKGGVLRRPAESPDALRPREPQPLTKIVRWCIIGSGVAYAQPPRTDPSPVFDGGKGTHRLRPLVLVRPSRTRSLGDGVRDAEGQMTANRNLKRKVRARAAKTGESYTAALRHFRPTSTGDPMPETDRRGVRLAVAQTLVRDAHPADLRASGAEVRELMHRAHRAGAKLVHFPEGATCWPNKYTLSAQGPDTLGPSDWARFPFDVLREELAAIAALAGRLRLWTVLGSVHRLTPPHRPHNSLYVFDDRGELVTRYDERMLSNTKISYMYTPGRTPVTFEVDGVRFGCALGIEVHFPELFGEYERLDVDCVLFSTTGVAAPQDTDMFAHQARSHASTNSYWVSFAIAAQEGPAAPAGVVAPSGTWLARAPRVSEPAFVVADVGGGEADAGIQVAIQHARPWRRTARAGIYDPHFVQDARSETRTAF